MGINGHKVRIGKLSEFRPQTANANKHTERGLRMLDDAMSEDGYVAPMTAVADAEIIDGSAMLERAFDKFNDEAIILEHDGKRPIITVRTDIPNANTKEAKRIAVRANRIAEVDLEWDASVLQSLEPAALEGMFSDKELAEILTQTGIEPKDAEPQIDKAEELRQKWGTETGQLWGIGNHRISCSDFTDKSSRSFLLSDERADCVFTSPPYAVGVDYGETYEDSIENLRQLLPRLSSSMLDAVVDGGFAVINFGDIASGRDVAVAVEPCEYPMALEYWPIFRADGWLLWSRRVWCKPNPRVHSPWCIQSNRAATDWEHVWTWRKPGNAIIKRSDGQFPSGLGWIDTTRMHGVDIGKETHGAGMAVGIAVWMLSVHSRKNSLVAEPCAGTGTTIVASESIGRKCYAAEISPAYVAVCLERMTTAFPNLKIEKVDQARAA